MNKEEIQNIKESLELFPDNMNKEAQESYYKLFDFIDKLQQENKQLKELYQKTCKHLFDIGNDELARYFKAQIDDNNTFTVGDM